MIQLLNQLKVAPIFTQAIGLVLAENQRVLQAIAYPAVEQLAQKIIDVERIFVIGEGCRGLAIPMAAMRLMHLGCQVYVVGGVPSSG